MRAAARILLPLLAVGVALTAAPATAQVSEGIKRSGPVPYVELYGRKTVRKPAKPRPKALAKVLPNRASTLSKPTPTAANVGALPTLATQAPATVSLSRRAVPSPPAATTPSPAPAAPVTPEARRFQLQCHDNDAAERKRREGLCLPAVL